MTKPRLGYIDHSFHKKTKSARFLRDILNEAFDVTDLWDESWNGGPALSVECINSLGFEYVLFFQSILPIRELKRLNAGIIWVPMYDGVVGLGKSFWVELTTVRIKILSFSEVLTSRLRGVGLDVMSVKYFFDPSEFEAVADYSGNKIFFWQRTNLNFSDVKKLIGNRHVDQVILKLDPDPGYMASLPSEEDVRRYNIRIVRDYLSKESYLNLLLESTVFISPRRFEGIGMSFLEAMAMGLAVVAVDNPTMNEYIVNTDTGYLFAPGNIREIDFSDREKIGRNARAYCESGYRRWSEEKEEIVGYILGDYREPATLSIPVRLRVGISNGIRGIFAILIKWKNAIRKTI